MPTIVASVDKTTVAPGDSFNLKFDLSGAEASPVATIQFDVFFTEGFAPKPSGFVTGQAANDAQKTITYQFINVGLLRFLVFGVNQSVIGSGTILTLPVDVVPDGPIGILPLSASAIVASSAQGTEVGVLASSTEIEIVAPDESWPFHLAWDSVGPGYSYRIYFANSPQGPFTHKDTTINTTWPIPLTFTADDYFQVRAVDNTDGRESESPSNTVQWNPPEPEPDPVPIVSNLRIEAD